MNPNGNIVTHQYFSKDGQFQVYNSTYLEGAKGRITQAVGNVDGDEGFTQVPWTCILSVDSVFDGMLHHGEDSQHLQNRKNLPIKKTWISGEHKLFSKMASSEVNGITSEMMTAMDSRKLTEEMESLDPSTGIIKHHMNYEIGDQQNRLKNSEWLDQHHYVENYMKSFRHTFPVERTHLKYCHEVCVTFMPPTRPGKAGWNRYDGYTNGAWLLWESDGEHTIKKNEELYEEEWIISATDASLSGGGRTGSENEGHIVHRGMPYKLTSPNITFRAQTNMILHIGRLREV